jgi:hypothetical protein
MEGQTKPTNEVPAAEVKAEGQKLEWGPELGEMSWNDLQTKISELNVGIVDKRKQWRLPNYTDFRFQFENTGSTSADFVKDMHWTSQGGSQHDFIVHIFGMHNGYGDLVDIKTSEQRYHVRLVRGGLYS